MGLCILSPPMSRPLCALESRPLTRVSWPVHVVSTPSTIHLPAHKYKAIFHEYCHKIDFRAALTKRELHVQLVDHISKKRFFSFPQQGFFSHNEGFFSHNDCQQCITHR